MKIEHPNDSIFFEKEKKKLTYMEEALKRMLHCTTSFEQYEKIRNIMEDLDVAAWADGNALGRKLQKHEDG